MKNTQQKTFSSLKKIIPLIALFALVYTSCNSPYIPKPAGYFKISFPQKKYREFNEPGFPYSFEYPEYAAIVRDSSFFGDTPENPWWINVEFPQFSGRMYISYKEIGKYKLDALISDAYKLTGKQTVRANYIDDSLLSISPDVHGVLFKVTGDVATAAQFFLTDSAQNFLRGSLYFDAPPNQDSLQPVNDFLLQDMRHLINTFQWKK